MDAQFPDVGPPGTPFSGYRRRIIPVSIFFRQSHPNFLPDPIEPLKLVIGPKRLICGPRSYNSVCQNTSQKKRPPSHEYEHR